MDVEIHQNEKGNEFNGFIKQTESRESKTVDSHNLKPCRIRLSTESESIILDQTLSSAL